MKFFLLLAKKLIQLIICIASATLCLFKKPSKKKPSLVAKSKVRHLPVETFLDILRFFDRKSLTKLQTTSRKLYTIVSKHFSTYPLFILKASIKYERDKFSIWKQFPNAKNSMWISIENTIYLSNKLCLDYNTLVSSKFLRFSTTIFFFSNSSDKNAEAFVKYAYPLRHLWTSMIVKINADFTTCRSEFLYSKIFSSGLFASCFGIYVNNLSYKSQIGPRFNVGDRSLLNLSDILNTHLVYVRNIAQSSASSNESIINWLFEKHEIYRKLNYTHWSYNERILILHCITLNSKISWIIDTIKKKFLTDSIPCAFHFVQVHNKLCRNRIASIRLKNKYTKEFLLSWEGEGIDCDGNKYNTTVISRYSKFCLLEAKMNRPFLFYPFN